MCILFKTNGDVNEYVKKGYKYPFPTAPCLKCRSCGQTVRFRKHGYRERWYISSQFKGTILIRRYICPCKHFTISMIPDFCLIGFTNSFEQIFNCIYKIFTRNCNLNVVLRELNSQSKLCEISRQQSYFYRKRLLQNLTFLETGLRCINSEIKLPPKGKIKQERAKGLLKLVKTEFTTLIEFTQKFHKGTDSHPLALLKLS